MPAYPDCPGKEAVKWMSCLLTEVWFGLVVAWWSQSTWLPSRYLGIGDRYLYLDLVTERMSVMMSSKQTHHAVHEFHLRGLTS